MNISVKKRDGGEQSFDSSKVRASVARCGEGLEVSVDLVVAETVKNLFNGVATGDVERAAIFATASLIEKDPDYSYLAARIFQQKIRKEVFGRSTARGSTDADAAYRASFVSGIRTAVGAGLLDSRMAEFDLGRLAARLDPGRDDLFKYIGLQTIYERYLLKHDGRRLETPQAFWMRVAMGLAIGEKPAERDDYAERFYAVMSRMLYIPSTPTLFHAGTSHPQLASCFLSTVDDDLHAIVASTGENAVLAKWSGGVATDYTNLRACGAFIKTTKVESQGVIPFLKVENDWTIAINRSGKRRGAKAVYLETWHYDIEDFLDLRRNTGDERRRTPDMNTVNWIPDLFIKRYVRNEDWSLFSPDEVPELHHIYGKRFEEKYAEYEAKAARGEIKIYKKIPARKLGRKMLTMLFETGHPWWTFKDAMNLRSPQDHAGVIHCSNLCSEIALNTSADETAVCNLGSLVICNHVRGGGMDWPLLSDTVHLAMRMLDNVIDENYYPVEKARTSNFRHRPVGLGSMGWQEALYLVGVNYEDSEPLQDEIQEFISYNAIDASSDLAAERGAYSSYKGSKWDRGIFPLDTLDLLEEERGVKIPVSRQSRLDWHALKAKVARDGMRNSLTQAQAPTATIANIAGVTPCAEPIFKNVYVKSNMSGEFVVINDHLVRDLKDLGLWDQKMLDLLKFHDGSVQKLPIPDALKLKYKEAFEVDQKKSIDLCAVRGKWFDQSQSFNIFYRGNDGNELEGIYLYAWLKGLKTTYYLRTLGVSQSEKATLGAEFGFTQKRNADKVEIAPEPVKLCKINDPTCESCQ